MSTNCRIFLKLKKEDINKFKKANPSLFNAEEWNNNTPKVKIKNATYISCYIHWCGSITDNGILLDKEWKDYDSILNLILCGSLSFIEKDKKIKSYYAWRKEGWLGIKPYFSDTMKNDEHYSYMFDYETNKWYYVDCNGKILNDLKSEIKKLIHKKHSLT